MANVSHPDAVAKGQSQTQGMPVSDVTGGAEDKLSGLLDRINSITATASSAEQVEQIVQQDEVVEKVIEDTSANDLEEFIPDEPESLYEAKLNESLVEALIVKYLSLIHI